LNVRQFLLGKEVILYKVFMINVLELFTSLKKLIALTINN